jgi:hypothetical protein
MAQSWFVVELTSEHVGLTGETDDRPRLDFILRTPPATDLIPRRSKSDSSAVISRRDVLTETQSKDAAVKISRTGIIDGD